jgi:hypothetical protein
MAGGTRTLYPRAYQTSRIVILLIKIAFLCNMKVLGIILRAQAIFTKNMCLNLFTVYFFYPFKPAPVLCNSAICDFIFLYATSASFAFFLVNASASCLSISAFTLCSWADLI